MALLDPISRWPGTHAAGTVSAHRGTVTIELAGDAVAAFPHASVTKIAASLAVLVEVSAGRCGLDDAVGPPGATLAHLLSHASGLPLHGTEPVAPPGRRRVYSNTGIDLAVAHAACLARVTPAVLVAERVFGPLGMSHTRLVGAASSGVVGTTEDLCALAGELLVPTLVPAPLAARQRAVAFPGLIGVLPGFGRQEPCDWGLGVEVRGAKHPHWTGTSWPPTAVGHFGQVGGFLVADVDAGLALVTLGDEPFGPWATSTWPEFTDRVRTGLLARGV